MSQSVVAISDFHNMLLSSAVYSTIKVATQHELAYFVARCFIVVAIWLKLLVSKFLHLVKLNHALQRTHYSIAIATRVSIV